MSVEQASVHEDEHLHAPVDGQLEMPVPPVARWPRSGRCSACTRPAIAFPSGNWEHVYRPCALRSGGAVRGPMDLPLPPCQFVPDGEPLPGWSGTSWPMVVAGRDESGFPSALGWVAPERVEAHWASIRERLARETS